MNFVVQLLAIVACGALGAAAGWALAASLGLGGVTAALIALPVAMAIAVGAWALGVAHIDRWRRKRVARHEASR